MSVIKHQLKAGGQPGSPLHGRRAAANPFGPGAGGGDPSSGGAPDTAALDASPAHSTGSSSRQASPRKHPGSKRNLAGPDDGLDSPRGEEQAPAALPAGGRQLPNFVAQVGRWSLRAWRGCSSCAWQCLDYSIRNHTQQIETPAVRAADDALQPAPV